MTPQVIETRPWHKVEATFLTGANPRHQAFGFSSTQPRLSNGDQRRILAGFRLLKLAGEATTPVL